MKKAYIAVGSNLSPHENIKSAVILLRNSVKIGAISTFYMTKPLLNLKQPDYINGVWQVNTTETPENLKFKILRQIETQLKRIRTKDRYIARTIDLDLILYENLVIKQDRLTLPDPDIYTRSFIAIPLFELTPELILPDTGKRISEIIKQFNEVSLIPDTDFTNQIKELIHK